MRLVARISIGVVATVLIARKLHGEGYVNGYVDGLRQAHTRMQRPARSQPTHDVHPVVSAASTGTSR